MSEALFLDPPSNLPKWSGERKRGPRRASRTKAQSPIRQQIIDRLAASGRTAYWLAQAAGLSRAQVNEYLKGERDVATEYADRMLAALTALPN